MEQISTYKGLHTEKNFSFLLLGPPLPATISLCLKTKW